MKDATAAPKHPQRGYGYFAALINYAFLAHAVLTTDETVKAMRATIDATNNLKLGYVSRMT